MSELISRQKLIEELMELSMVGIGKRNPKGSKEEMLYEDYIKLDTVLELIESQPPADQWIPCSSGIFPTEKGWYFVTTDWSGGYVDIILYYPYIDGKFEDYIKRRFGDVEILAWMPLPLPEPYKGVE